MTNHYGRGAHVERLGGYHLDVDGYVTTRAAGSKGKIDQFALKPGQLLVVQYKISGRIDGAEWNRLHELAGWVGGVPLLGERDLKAGCQERHRSHQQRPELCGIRFWQLLGRYVPRTPMRLQPCRPWHSDEIAAAVDVVDPVRRVLARLADEVGGRATPFAAGVRTALAEIGQAIA